MAGKPSWGRGVVGQGDAGEETRLTQGSAGQENPTEAGKRQDEGEWGEENSAETGNGGKEDGEIWKMESAFSMPGGAPCPEGRGVTRKKAPSPGFPSPGFPESPC